MTSLKETLFITCKFEISKYLNTKSEATIGWIQCKLSSHPCSISYFKVTILQERVGFKKLGWRCLHRFHKGEVVIIVTVTLLL